MWLFELNIFIKLAAYILLLIELVDLSLLCIYCCLFVLVELSFLAESWLMGAGKGKGKLDQP